MSITTAGVPATPGSLRPSPHLISHLDWKPGSQDSRFLGFSEAKKVGRDQLLQQPSVSTSGGRLEVGSPWPSNFPMLRSRELPCLVSECVTLGMPCISCGQRFSYWYLLALFSVPAMRSWTPLCLLLTAVSEYSIWDDTLGAQR